MRTEGSATGKRRILTVLGVGGDAEDVYRALLANPGASVGELRVAVGLGERRMRSALAELELKAMIAKRGGPKPGFQPAPPSIVVEALVSAREGELNRARLDARELEKLLRTDPEQLHLTELVEILTSREALAARWTQLQRVTRESIESFARPPLAQQALSEHEPLQGSLGRHGVRMRAVYDADALRYPGTLGHIRRMAALGEQARVVSRLPLKLALFDRRIALVPLTQSHPDSTVDAGLVVNRSALLDALIALFDLHWQSATPMRIGEEASADGHATAGENAVLTLLASGLKDESIARELGVSTPTVRRRIAGVLERLGVTTRFQAGLALGRRELRTLPDRAADVSADGALRDADLAARIAEQLGGETRP